MAADDEDRPRKKITHEIGQELALLSVGELDRAHRAAARPRSSACRRRPNSKQASRNAADKFFKS